MKNFAGENPSADKLHFANSLNFISKDCAPAFIVHATNDKAAPVQGSISYYLKLIENGVPAEMHIFGEGGHGGIGFKNKKNPEDEWVNLLLRWKYLY
jgi:dipeptidyl aminopeptidase/acylaminoacyl peptidase